MARAAAVRPYVFTHGSGQRLALEQVVAPYLAAPRPGRIVIIGDDAAGKTTALEHLAAVCKPTSGVVLLDEPSESDLDAHRGRSLVVATFDPTHAPRSTKDEQLRLSLAPWTQDDWIEYLLARHRAKCRSVMQRLPANADIERLDGSPLLLGIVLDRFADDEQLSDVFAALTKFVDSQPVSEADRADIADACIAAHCDGFVRADDFGELSNECCDPRMAQMLRLNAIQQLLVCQRLAHDLRSAHPPDYLGRPWTPDTVEFCGRRLHGMSYAIRRLTRHAHGRVGIYHPTAVSLLHAMGANWRPKPGRATNLIGARLARIQWAGVDLQRALLSEVLLCGADLTDALVSGTTATHANFAGACLHGARLERLMANRADFGNADLTHVRADHANFSRANLAGARLDGARLCGVTLTGAKLAHAKFVRADLTEANMERATFGDCDFSSALMEKVTLASADLTEVVLAGALFRGASLRNCNLEGQQIPGADFSAADLHGALLTGTVMPRANFREANLSEAGLAEIEWEWADLRDADLSGASFHLGSTRSGLVGSPLASEGTRTGFYTDEFVEQEFRSVEDIRKANLRGADLRGAKIEKTDFYLVDLRDAKYTPDQEVHLRRSGAILESRV